MQSSDDIYHQYDFDHDLNLPKVTKTKDWFFSINFIYKNKNKVKAS